MKKKQNFDSVIVKMNTVLNANNERSQSTLTTGRHTVALPHVKTVEHPLLQAQDLIHVVQKLDAHLIEFTSIIITNFQKGFFVN